MCSMCSQSKGIGSADNFRVNMWHDPYHSYAASLCFA